MTVCLSYFCCKVVIKSAFLLWWTFFFLFLFTSMEIEEEKAELTYFYGKIFAFANVVTSIHHYIYLFWDLAECFCWHVVVGPPTPRPASRLHHLLAHKATLPSSIKYTMCYGGDINTGASLFEVGWNTTKIFIQKSNWTTWHAVKLQSTYIEVIGTTGQHFHWSCTLDNGSKAKRHWNKKRCKKIMAKQNNAIHEVYVYTNRDENCIPLSLI